MTELRWFAGQLMTQLVSIGVLPFIITTTTQGRVEVYRRGDRRPIVFIRGAA